MKSTILLILTALLVTARSLPAQEAKMERFLTRALKLYPDADTDKDGKLSLPEVLSYVESHPELKSLLGELMVSKSKPATSASSTLPAGPRVFVCAHSFMIYTAKWLPPMAEGAGIGYRDAGQQMIGGSRVLQHWNLPDEKNKAKAALREGKVDVLTLSPHILLPDEGIDDFTKLGLEKNPKLRVLVQASWPAMDGEKGKKDEKGQPFTNEKRNEATVESLRQLRDGYRASWLAPLETQVRALNASVGHEAVCIVPVSEAVFALRERIVEGKAPGLTKQTALFADNLGHPLPPLAALVSYCHFASIFQRTPVGLPVPEQLKVIPQAEELNRLLQELAWDAVTHYPMSGVKAEAATTATAKP
jgi:hypothetical protein